MTSLVLLDANPVIAMIGQIAAIVICLFALIYILLAVAFNLAMAFGMAWVREKINLIKMLRPSVDSVVKASEASKNGMEPAANTNPVVRTVASLPTRMQGIDQKVDSSTERVVTTAIEFRARTVQVQTVLKTFFLPGLMQRRPSVEEMDGPAQLLQKTGKDFSSPGYRMLMAEQAAEGQARVGAADGHAENVPASQLKHVQTH